MYDRIMIASGGSLDVRVHYSGEIVPYYEEYKALRAGVLDAASLGPQQWMTVHGSKAILFGGSGTPASAKTIEILNWCYLADGLDLA